MSIQTCSIAWSRRSGSTLLGQNKLVILTPVQQCRPFGAIELCDERDQVILIDAPTPNRAGVDRPAHLRGACGAHRPFGPMEGKAIWIPLEAAMGEDAPRLAFQVADHILVVHIED